MSKFNEFIENMMAETSITCDLSTKTPADKAIDQNGNRVKFIWVQINNGDLMLETISIDEKQSDDVISLVVLYPDTYLKQEAKKVKKELKKTFPSIPVEVRFFLNSKYTEMRMVIRR